MMNRAFSWAFPKRCILAIAAFTLISIAPSVSADHSAGKIFDLHEMLDSSSGATVEMQDDTEVSAFDEALYYGRKVTVLVTVLYLRLFLP